MGGMTCWADGVKSVHTCPWARAISAWLDFVVYMMFSCLSTHTHAFAFAALPQLSSMTLYRALELGEEDLQQTTPFEASKLGIYSCHGAEPGWEEGEEVITMIGVRVYYF